MSERYDCAFACGCQACDGAIARRDAHLAAVSRAVEALRRDFPQAGRILVRYLADAGFPVEQVCIAVDETKGERG